MSDADVAFAGLAEQARMAREREVSSRELTELALRRIERLDAHVNAFRTVLGESALAEAEAAQARLDAGETAPLLGVPVALKDNVGVAGQIRATGTKANTTPVARDDELTRRLRAAGAVIVGLTHLPELAIWPFTESEGWGRTRNPWDLERQTGGSSGGSAAAVAAGMVAAASASDGGGSIRIPAACCGIFGLKPQRGRVSLAPWGEHWHGLSVSGCVTRSVRDSALWLEVAADAPAPFAAAALRHPGTLRIAASVEPPLLAPVAPEVEQAVRETTALLRGLGHDVRDRDPPWGLLAPAMVPLYLHGVHEDAASVEHPERLEARTRTLSRWGAALGGPALRVARARRRAATARLTALFDEVDVLITPVLARQPERSGRWEGTGAAETLHGASRYTPFTFPWNLTGQPAAAVPAGFSTDGLPLSVQLVGRPGDEATLLSLAAQLEAERPWADRRPLLGDG